MNLVLLRELLNRLGLSIEVHRLSLVALLGQTLSLGLLTKLLRPERASLIELLLFKRHVALITELLLLPGLLLLIAELLLPWLVGESLVELLGLASLGALV